MFPGHSSLADTSRQMLRRCNEEVDEMLECPSCFEAGVLQTQLSKNWFVKLCKPPHELVFAGSPPLPAKVSCLENFPNFFY